VNPTWVIIICYGNHINTLSIFLTKESFRANSWQFLLIFWFLPITVCFFGGYKLSKQRESLIHFFNNYLVVELTIFNYLIVSNIYNQILWPLEWDSLRQSPTLSHVAFCDFNSIQFFYYLLCYKKSLKHHLFFAWKKYWKNLQTILAKPFFSYISILLDSGLSFPNIKLTIHHQFQRRRSSFAVHLF